MNDYPLVYQAGLCFGQTIVIVVRRVNDNDSPYVLLLPNVDMVVNLCWWYLAATLDNSRGGRAACAHRRALVSRVYASLGRMLTRDATFGLSPRHGRGARKAICSWFRGFDWMMGVAH